MLEILDEQVIHSSPNGVYRYVRRWVKGWHPQLGELVWGWSGKETVILADIIRPAVIVEISPKPAE